MQNTSGFAQIGAATGRDLIDGMLSNMLAQDSGVIRVPLTKQETGFKSQLYANSTKNEDDEDESSSDSTVETTSESGKKV